MDIKDKGKIEMDKNTGRKTSSLTLFLSGIMVFISSMVLYVGPPTHVAHFSDWLFAGLTKCQWNALHVMSGLLFIIAMFFHIYFNWNAMLSYMKDRKRKIVLLTRPFVVSLFLTAYVCTGAVLELPPMGQIIEWIRSIKISHVQKYGSPPYGRAENASLANIAGYMGWDAEKCLASLRKNGFRVMSSEQSIKSIGKENGVSTGIILENMSNSQEGY